MITSAYIHIGQVGYESIFIISNNIIRYTHIFIPPCYYNFIINSNATMTPKILNLRNTYAEQAFNILTASLKMQD